MANKFTQPDGLAPGIYLDLPEKKYHADTALSHTDMVNLLIGRYLTYWISSALNPDRVEDRKASTPAIELGTYSHEFLLNEKLFLDTYNCSSSTFNVKKKIIAKSMFDRVKESINEIKRVPDAYKMFQNGYPEISIILVMPDGIRVRCRMDWLRIFGGIDYKRVRTLLPTSLGWFINDNGHDIQEVHYTQIMKEAKTQLRAGTLPIIAGDVKYDPEWFKLFMNEPRTMFRFFYQRSERPYIFDIYRFDPEILQNAADDILRAKTIYVNGITEHGTKRPFAGTAKTKEFSVYHLPRRAQDRGETNEG